MRKIILIICLMVISSEVIYSQGVAEYKMNSKIKELTKMGIDTIMVYGPSGGGVRTYFDNSPCYVYHNDRYLIWVHKKHNYILLIDECYEYKVLKDQLTSMADLLIQHLYEMTQENLKQPTIKVIDNGKEVLSAITTSDDLYYCISFYIKGNKYVKAFSLDYLTDEYFDNHRNIYYDQNRQTHLKQAFDIMEKALPTLKFKKK